MKIAVCGTSIGEIRREILKKSGELGKEIAKNSHILMFGACLGYPYEAAKGTFQNLMTELKFTGLGIPERNIPLVKGSDAVIIISGQIGTLSKFFN